MNRRMIDFHSHMLPQMDDGSASLEESLEMLRQSAEQGVEAVVLTPHFYAVSDNPAHFLEKRSRRMAELTKALSEQTWEKIPRLISGAEVRYFEGITEMEDLPEMRIEGTSLLLVEMPFCRWNDRMIRDLVELNSGRGLSVVLAHIERYPDSRNRRLLEYFLSEGILIQSNAEAFLRGFRSGRFMKMLAMGQIHFMGSDAHNTTSRFPNMGAAYDAIAKRFGEGLMAELYQCEQRLLEG